MDGLHGHRQLKGGGYSMQFFGIDPYELHGWLGGGVYLKFGGDHLSQH
jgi:hypothetical protein